jgi:hypothetical protein
VLGFSRYAHRVLVATLALAAGALLAATLMTYLHRLADVADTAPPSPLTRALGFLGIGALPTLAAAALFLAGFALVGLAIGALATAHFGNDAPSWLPADVLLCALGGGLAALNIGSPK